MRKTTRLDLTQGSVIKKILLFAIPIMLGNLLQQFYSAADRIVVGQFAKDGTVALAAVGATSSATALIVGMFVGIATGVNVICANLLGAKKAKALRQSMHTAVLVSLVCGFIVGLLGVLASRQILLWMATPADVLDQATLYMRIYFMGVPASLMYNFGAGILRAHGDTKRPMYILLISGVLNVVLNIVLVVGFHRSVDGVAIATAASQLLSAAMVLRILFDPKDQYKLTIRELHIHTAQLTSIIRVGVPSGLSSMVFSISNVILQSSVNSFGDAAIIAGKTAAIDTSTLIYQVLAAMLATCVSFAGQCYGAREYKRIDKLALTACGLCWGVMGSALVICYFFAPQMISLFNPDPEVIRHGTTILRINCIGYLIYIPSEIFLGCSRGMKFAGMPALLNFLAICVTRLIWIWTVFPQHKTVPILFLCYPISWGISSVLQIINYVLLRRKIDRQLANTQKAAAQQLPSA